MFLPVVDMRVVGDGVALLGGVRNVFSIIEMMGPGTDGPMGPPSFDLHFPPVTSQTRTTKPSTTPQPNSFFKS